MGGIKQHPNPLWEKGYQFYCVTPKTRHRVHSQWSVNDWVQIYESNFGDPYRMDKRTPGSANTRCTSTRKRRKTAASTTATIVMWTANPVDRPYRGWKPSDPFYKGCAVDDPGEIQIGIPVPRHDGEACALCLTAKSVKGHETRPDGRAIAVDTGYQSNFRYGAQQSFTRNWLMPMHQPTPPGQTHDCLEVQVGLCHRSPRGINTVPKECLIRITKAEDGGIGARGPGTSRTGFTPGQENEFMIKWLKETYQDQGLSEA